MVDADSSFALPGPKFADSVKVLEKFSVLVQGNPDTHPDVRVFAKELDTFCNVSRDAMKMFEGASESIFLGLSNSQKALYYDFIRCATSGRSFIRGLFEIRYRLTEEELRAGDRMNVQIEADMNLIWRIKQAHELILDMCNVVAKAEHVSSFNVSQS